MTLWQSYWVTRRVSPRIISDVHVERCNPGKWFELGTPRCALNVSGCGHAVRPGQHSYRYPPRLPVLLRRSFQQGNGTHTFDHRVLHPHRNSCESRKYKLRCCPSSTRTAIQRSLTGRATHKRAKCPWPPTGYLAELGSWSLKSHTDTKRGDFSARSVQTSSKTSVTTTLSHVVMCMPCGATMMPWPQMSCWS